MAGRPAGSGARLLKTTRRGRRARRTAHGEAVARCTALPEFATVLKRPLLILKLARRPRKSFLDLVFFQSEILGTFWDLRSKKEALLPNSITDGALARQNVF